MAPTSTPSTPVPAQRRPLVDGRDGGVSRRTASTAVAGWGTAVVAAMGVAAAYVTAVGTSTGQYLDERLMTRAGSVVTDTRWADALLTDLVRAPFLVLGTAVAVLLAALVHGGRRAAAVAGVAAATVVVSQLLKAALDRPALTDAVAFNSFPSGHVAAVAGLAAALVLAVPRLLRTPVALLALPLVGAVAAATVVLQWHRPSDVVASVLLAVAFAGVAEALTPGRRRRRARGSAARP